MQTFHKGGQHNYFGIKTPRICVNSMQHNTFLMPCLVSPECLQSSLQSDKKVGMKPVANSGRAQNGFVQPRRWISFMATSSQASLSFITPFGTPWVSAEKKLRARGPKFSFEAIDTFPDLPNSFLSCAGILRMAGTSQSLISSSLWQRNWRYSSTQMTPLWTSAAAATTSCPL